MLKWKQKRLFKQQQQQPNNTCACVVNVEKNLWAPLVNMHICNFMYVYPEPSAPHIFYHTLCPLLFSLFDNDYCLPAKVNDRPKQQQQQQHDLSKLLQKSKLENAPTTRQHLPDVRNIPSQLMLLWHGMANRLHEYITWMMGVWMTLLWRWYIYESYEQESVGK